MLFNIENYPPVTRVSLRGAFANYKGRPRAIVDLPRLGAQLFWSSYRDIIEKVKRESKHKPTTAHCEDPDDVLAVMSAGTVVEVVNHALPFRPEKMVQENGEWQPPPGPSTADELSRLVASLARDEVLFVRIYESDEACLDDIKYERYPEEQMRKMLDLSMP